MYLTGKPVKQGVLRCSVGGMFKLSHFYPDTFEAQSKESAIIFSPNQGEQPYS